jgi:hypothetical protein
LRSSQIKTIFAKLFLSLWATFTLNAFACAFDTDCHQRQQALQERQRLPDEKAAEERVKKEKIAAELTTKQRPLLKGSDDKDVPLPNKGTKFGSFLQQGVEYTYYLDGSCKELQGQKCLSHEEYKSICQIAIGISRNFLASSAVFRSDEDKVLLTAGEISQTSIYLGRSSEGNDICFASFASSGIYRGNSARKAYSIGVSTFIKNSKSEVLAHRDLLRH